MLTRFYTEGAGAVSRAATGRGEAEQPDSKIYEHVLGQVGLLQGVNPISAYVLFQVCHW